MLDQRSETVHELLHLNTFRRSIGFSIFMGLARTVFHMSASCCCHKLAQVAGFEACGTRWNVLVVLNPQGLESSRAWAEGHPTCCSAHAHYASLLIQAIGPCPQNIYLSLSLYIYIHVYIYICISCVYKQNSLGRSTNTLLI